MRLTQNRFSRRRFLQSTLATGAVALSGGFPAISRAADRPLVTHGVQSGDVSFDQAVLWSRTDRPAEAVFEWATTESFKNARTLPALAALPESDFTAKILAEGLPAGQDIFYRVRFRNLDDLGVESEPAIGRLRTAPSGLRDVSFVWSGDTVGQGWGINPEWGGMKGYATMLKHDPDFFIHSGDNVYADGPLKEEVTLPDGTKWKNIVIPEKTKVAETLAEFRGQYKYNFMDENVRALYAAVPVLTQWDDHEVVDNWSPSKVLGNAYQEKKIAVARCARGPGFPRVHADRHDAGGPAAGLPQDRLRAAPRCLLPRHAHLSRPERQTISRARKAASRPSSAPTSSPG